ncbi:MAG: CAP domain-containing protein [Saprospiraceae bacterium]|nr:CAP domain-containing protein [Saprospiraceae bacterium]
MKWILIWLAFVSMLPANDISGPDAEFKDYMINRVNEIRNKGCKCGRVYMQPVGPVRWNETLYRSAEVHAKEMMQFNYFAHFSKDGLDIGDRLQKAGYNWQVAGENLGEGQKDFEEVLQDWLESPSHCRMILHPRVTEMGVAKIGKYWVQHFGKPMP